jgi:hypothetical protein
MTQEPSVAIDAAEAVRRARRLLESLSHDLDEELAWYDGVFGVETVRETDQEWIYRWNSTAYMRSGDIMDQILIGSIVVPKDGSSPWTMGTAGTEDEELDRHRRRS